MNNKNYSMKTTKIGTMSVAMSLVLVAVIVVVNLIVGQLPSTFTKLDTSSNDMYSIGEITRDIIKSVDSKVKMYLVAETGGEDTVLLEFMKRYEALNSNISVETVDPIVRPSFTGKYTDETLESNSIIVESDKRSTIINYNQIYMYETEIGTLTYEEYVQYYYYYQLEGTECFYGEIKLTAALDYVTTEDLPNIYMLSSHGESSFDAGYLSYIDSENLNLKTLKLLETETVPEDCEVLVINTPTSDISADEATMLEAYLDRGGNIVLITYFQYYTAEKMPNLTKIVNKMGLSSMDGVVCESNRNNYYQYPSCLLPMIGDGGFLSSTDFYVLMANAHGIKIDSESDAVFNELLATTTGAYLKSKLDSSTPMTKEEGDVEGQYLLGVVSTINYGFDNESRLMWFSSSSIVSDSMDQVSGYGNSNMFISALSWLCGKESDVSIIAKGMQVKPLQLTSSETVMWGVVVVGVLPVFVIAAGLVTWLRRRKK